MNKIETIATVVVVFVLFLAAVWIFWVAGHANPPDPALFGVGTVLSIAAAVFGLFGRRLKKLAGGGVIVELSEHKYVEEAARLAGSVKKNELDQTTLIERKSYGESKVLPGTSAPDYTALDIARMDRLLVRPSAYPMTPMYLLNKDYRILDWNEAFSLAFDRTMEGHQGQGILGWTYYLDNYQSVLDHAETVFADPDRPPLIDVEDIVYMSLRYGRIEGVKRAYQIPDDDGRCIAWLITLELDFANPKEKARYRYELLRLIGLDQLWSEYAISYDRILTNVRVYRDLLDTLIGNIGPLSALAPDAKVLDLGPGTGNLSLRLLDGASRRTVLALDNNRVMLEFLRDKCRGLLRDDYSGTGIIAVKQDATSLFGLPNDCFDCVIANNVFYALPDLEATLEACLRVLKPGGELRMSGPKADTDLEVLFRRIRSDLESAGTFREYQADYEHVEQINKLRLKPMLHRWGTQEFCQILQQAGFLVNHSSEDIYAGQSMLISASKPTVDVTDDYSNPWAKDDRAGTARVDRASSKGPKVLASE
ncbi:MAG: class I SAM-dependent methyltransferase [Methylococcales bacterium]